MCSRAVIKAQGDESAVRVAMVQGFYKKIPRNKDGAQGQRSQERRGGQKQPPPREVPIPREDCETNYRDQESIANNYKRPHGSYFFLRTPASKASQPAIKQSP